MTQIEMAKAYADSTMVPRHYRGNVADCFVAIQMAERLNCEPFLVIQNLQVIHGTPSFSAKFLIALAEKSGVIGPITFTTTGEGENVSVEASANLCHNGEPVSCCASMELARKEGWSKNSKYRSMPEQMLSYRAASMLIRLYAPGATLGMHSTEELAVHGAIREDGTSANASGMNNDQHQKPKLPPPTAEGLPPVVWGDEHDNLTEALESDNIQEQDFLDWANKVGKDLPDGGYSLISEIHPQRIAALLDNWNKWAPKIIECSRLS